VRIPALHKGDLAAPERHGEFGLGQHPLPDGTTSFYAAAPSGFDIEIGAGAAAFLAPQEPAPSSVISLWGHRPSLRAPLRIVRALALGGLRRWVG
jgi:hypothetical protein